MLAPMSSGGGSPWMGSAGLFMGFPFLFNLSRRVSNRLRKYHIYRDLCAEAVAMPAS
jgi:hypothetical protein